MSTGARLSPRDRVRAWWGLVLLLVLLVYTPLFVARPVGEDFAVYDAAARSAASLPDLGRDLLDLRPGSDGRPLAALSLCQSAYVWTSEGLWTPLAYFGLRLENLLLLLVAAYMMSRFVRRLVVPWTGSDQAVAAGYASWLLLVIHPLSVSAVASPGARGDLLGGALALAAGTAFLRGRQERRYRFVALAALLTLLATWASELGFLLPLWLSLIEYYSSRRYRAGATRLRTALTTLVVFGVVAGLDPLLRGLRGADPWPLHLSRSAGAFLDLGTVFGAVLRGLEKVGVLMLPVNGSEGGLGWIVGGLVIIVVLQPALHAGRSAPRFWATVLLAWLAMVTVTVSLRVDARVIPGEFSEAAEVFPAVLVMAMGLGLSSTAVTGRRRYGLPLIAALLLGVLARTNAEAYRSAGDRCEDLRLQVRDVIAAGGGDERYLLVEPLHLQRGYRILPARLEDLYLPGVDEVLGGRSLWLRGLGSDALIQLSRTPRFDEWRGEGLVLVQHRVRVPSSSRPGGARQPVDRWRGQALELTGAFPSVSAWRNAESDLEPEENALGRGHWGSVSGDVQALADSASIETITVDLGEVSESELEDPPALYWRARGGLSRGGALLGAWVEVEDGVRAVFDPGGDPEWLLGPRVDSLLLMGPLADAAQAEVHATPPTVAGVDGFEIRSEDWWFAPSAPCRVHAEEERSWILTLLDLAELRTLELPCLERDDGTLLVEDAEEVLQLFWSGRGALVWALERRAAVEGGRDVVVARSWGSL